MQNTDINSIFNLQPNTFEELALDVFRHQAATVPIYKAFLELLHCNSMKVDCIKKIPFLPISFFKTHTITAASVHIAQTFVSSGTTQSIRSQHHVVDISYYDKSIDKAFTYFFGNLSDYCVIGLLPSYVENKNASLIYMVNRWMRLSNHANNGMYLNDYTALKNTLLQLKANKKKTILIGVTFALLDFIKDFSIDFKELIIIETGGMKGRGSDIDRETLHSLLLQSFQQSIIGSEYGMTELLSQSFMFDNSNFKSPHWKKILIRERDDPFAVGLLNKAGGVNCIDLANYNSCSFIATDDLGIAYADGSFSILGRLDNSELRGCNQLVLY